MKDSIEIGQYTCASLSEGDVKISVGTTGTTMYVKEVKR